VPSSPGARGEPVIPCNYPIARIQEGDIERELHAHHVDGAAGLEKEAFPGSQVDAPAESP
jgi:hypothetical protein